MNPKFTERFICESCGKEKLTSPEYLAKLNSYKAQGEKIECSKCIRIRASAERESDYLEYMAGEF